MQVFVGALIRGQTHVLISNMVGCRGQICTLISSGSQDSESAFLPATRNCSALRRPKLHCRAFGIATYSIFRIASTHLPACSN